VQTQGINIRRYYEYLNERVRGYRDTKTDFVRAGVGRMKRLTIDKGLLRQTEIVQDEIEALIRCDVSRECQRNSDLLNHRQFLGNHDPDNEITLTAFRLLTLDLLELYRVMNEGTINVLGKDSLIRLRYVLANCGSRALFRDVPSRCGESIEYL